MNFRYNTIYTMAPVLKSVRLPSKYISLARCSVRYISHIRTLQRAATGNLSEKCRQRGNRTRSGSMPGGHPTTAPRSR